MWFKVGVRGMASCNMRRKMTSIYRVKQAEINLKFNYLRKQDQRFESREGTPRERNTYVCSIAKAKIP
jgi:hypothetical protein